MTRNHCSANMDTTQACIVVLDAVREIIGHRSGDAGALARELESMCGLNEAVAAILHLATVGGEPSREEMSEAYMLANLLLSTMAAYDANAAQKFADSEVGPWLVRIVIGWRRYLSAREGAAADAAGVSWIVPARSQERGAE